MLILTRQAGQKIKIGDDIEIVVLKSQVNSSYVRLGIEAPQGTSIHREEIYNKINNIEPVFKKRRTEITDKGVKISYKSNKIFQNA